MSASWPHSQLLSASLQMGKTDTKALLSASVFRPDPRRKSQRKRRLVLAEVLHSEYSSGLEAGGTKGGKQGKQRGFQVAPRKPGPWRE